MKKTYFLITHSLGELDALLPILFELNSQTKLNVSIIITVKKIYNQYLKNEFYRDFFSKLNINITFTPLLSKFDPYYLKHFNDEIFIINIFKMFYNSIYINNFFSLFLSIKFLLKNPKIVLCKSIFYDASNQLNNNFIAYVLFNLLNKQSFVYHHGLTLLQAPNTNYKTNTMVNKRSVALLYNPLAKEWAVDLGYVNFHYIGVTKFFPHWINYIQAYNKFDIKNERYIVIYSRQSGHDYYMDDEKYKYLLVTSYEVIREQLPDYKIYIKTHPRENYKYLEEIISDYKMENIALTNLHAAILAKNALLTVSLWTSTILDSLSLKIPSVEFYVEAKKFRILEPRGSMFKYFGIHSVSSKESLSSFVKECIEQKYIFPSIVNEYFANKDLSVFFE